MDTLSFKRRTGKTDYELTCIDEEYILAEIIINDRPFIEIAEQHLGWNLGGYDYNHIIPLYMQLTCAPESYSSDDGWPGKNNAVLLICGECYIEEDTPLLITFTETETEVVWYGFYTDHRIEDNRDLTPFFRFEKLQYQAALAQLKIIADEVYTANEN